MTKELRQALSVCPDAFTRKILALPEQTQRNLEELRLRVGQRGSLLVHGKEILLDGAEVDKHCFEYVLAKATGQAVYSAQEMLKHCFLTILGGHRLGICGRAVYRDGELFSVREISSMNLRIARQFLGIADRCTDFLWTRPFSALIIGPPGRGKTTLLRDLIRQLSNRFGWRICVADERLELAACHNGVPQFDIGIHTDVLSGATKAESIDILLRTMNPQWIALDEITSETDVQAILRASYCGVRFLATAHAWNREELKARPVYQELLRSGVFQNLLILRPDRQVAVERMEQHA